MSPEQFSVIIKIPNRNKSITQVFRSEHQLSLEFIFHIRFDCVTLSVTMADRGPLV